MSKWIKTAGATYLNSSHIRVFWIRHHESTDHWHINARLDPTLDSDEFKTHETIYTIGMFRYEEEAVKYLEKLIHDLESEAD